ncbi:hypothetical protein LTS18_002394, partial [Coniosporium uncinatum]
MAGLPERPAAAGAGKKTIYIDENTGLDENTQTGGEDAPYKSVQFAYLQHADEAEYKVRKEGEDSWQPAAKAALKKAATYRQTQQKKAAKEKEQREQQEKQAADRLKSLEEAKKIVLEKDSSLDDAIRIRLDVADPDKVQLRKEGSEEKVKPVKVLGRVHRFRRQKDVLFITLRDAYGELQCVLSGKVAQTYDALTIQPQTSLELYGEMFEVPAGYKAPDNRELRVSYFKSIIRAPGGDEAFSTV